MESDSRRANLIFFEWSQISRRKYFVSKNGKISMKEFTNVSIHPSILEVPTVPSCHLELFRFKYFGKSLPNPPI